MHGITDDQAHRMAENLGFQGSSLTQVMLELSNPAML